MTYNQPDLYSLDTSACCQRTSFLERKNAVFILFIFNVHAI
jgi:hypothetical protein